jgi:hypothetical protein
MFGFRTGETAAMTSQGSPDVNSKSVVQSAAKVFAVPRAFDAAALEPTFAEVAERGGLDRGISFRMFFLPRERQNIL